MCKEWKEYTLVSLVSLAYLMILTWNIPFFWMDYVNVPIFSKVWDYHLLNYGYEFYFRPVENMFFYVFLHLFGIESFSFRIFKAVITCGICCFMYYFLKKNTGNKYIASAGTFFFLTSSAVIQSVMYIYDFEVVVELLLLFLTYLFFKMYDAFSLRKMLVWIGVFYIALLTKESAKMFLGVIILFILCENWKKLKIWGIPLVLVTLLAIAPGLFIGLKNNSGSLLQTLVVWFEWQHLFLFLKYLWISQWSVILISLGGIYLLLKSQSFESVSFKSVISEHKEFTFFFLWFCISVILTFVVPITDLRYAIVPLVPFTMAAWTLIGKIYAKSGELKKKIILCCIILLVINATYNTAMSLKYRCGAGNYFILLDETKEFTEQFENTTFMYTDSSANFFNHLLNTNTYIPYTQPVPENTFFFAFQSPLIIPEKENATLVKTFQKGPHCFMVYQQGNKTITHTEFSNPSYVFSEPTSISYCSIEFNTRFFIPSEITVTAVGDTENATLIIAPPIGKYKSCEYSCPRFTNNNTKIQSIEIKGSDTFLTKIYGASINYKKI